MAVQQTVHQSGSGLVKMLDSLQADLRTLASECKRKHPQVKEVYLVFLNKI